MIAHLYDLSMVFILIFSAIAIFSPDLLYSIVFLGAASLSLSFVFFILQAPDIAITQAAVGVAIVVALLVIAVFKTERME